MKLPLATKADLNLRDVWFSEKQSDQRYSDRPGSNGNQSFNQQLFSFLINWLIIFLSHWIIVFPTKLWNIVKNTKGMYSDRLFYFTNCQKCSNAQFTITCDKEKHFCLKIILALCNWLYVNDVYVPQHLNDLLHFKFVIKADQKLNSILTAEEQQFADERLLHSSVRLAAIVHSNTL